ncbi:hypothetical protein B0H19DRAFT_1067401 [Mycena capillaripes]|nr:hypothetical protein B0H19DRAFT_1067401 [Mycena capillaripes]
MAQTAATSLKPPHAPASEHCRPFGFCLIKVHHRVGTTTDPSPSNYGPKRTIIEGFLAATTYYMHIFFWGGKGMSRERALIGWFDRIGHAGIPICRTWPKPTGEAVIEGFKSGSAKSVTPATCLKLHATISFFLKFMQGVKLTPKIWGRLDNLGSHTKFCNGLPPRGINITSVLGIDEHDDPESIFCSRILASITRHQPGCAAVTAARSASYLGIGKVSANAETEYTSSGIGGRWSSRH